MPERPLRHLAHANGYLPGCYRALLADWEDEYEDYVYPFRPLQTGSDPLRFRSWHDLARDLIATLNNANQCRPWIRVGHSLGAVGTLLAAARRPDLFSGLVLVDPLFLPRRWYWAGRMVPMGVHHHLVPLARQAMRRRDPWPDLISARTHLRRKSIFRRIPDPVFDDLMSAFLHPSPHGGVELAYSRQWEARIYNTLTDPYAALARGERPRRVLRGAFSDTMLPRVWDRVRRINPRATFLEVPDYGHLLPFERPQVIAAQVRDFLMAG
jgi:pimeloyl-ACP methyl ester carboxylesterase